MDLSKVTKQHIEAAIKKFIYEKPEHIGKYSSYLVYEGKKIPLEYLSGSVYSIATGEKIPLSDFLSDFETVNFFENYDYTVEYENLTDNKNHKYSVNEAVWIATALMAAEKYDLDPNVTRDDMYFKQSDIIHRAQAIANGKVDAARVSWWVNADNTNSTQNYLRADHPEKSAARRLSMMYEFSNKSYPLDLNGEDELDMNGHPYKMRELLNFVRNIYPEVIRKMHKITIDYIGILNYLENNQEIPYSNPNALDVEAEEKKRLLEVKKKGQIAVAEMKKIAIRCDALYGLDKCLPISWLDGSNTKTRKYLWAQLKYKEYDSSPVSISLFVERNTVGNAVYRVSLEVKNDGTDKATMAKYHSHLDMPIQDGMVYVAGSNEWGRPDVINASQNEIKSQLDEGLFRKVQLCIYIEPSIDKTNEQYDTEIMEAVHKLIPYYEYVIGKTSAVKKEHGF